MSPYESWGQGEFFFRVLGHEDPRRAPARRAARRVRHGSLVARRPLDRFSPGEALFASSSLSSLDLLGEYDVGDALRGVELALALLAEFIASSPPVLELLRVAVAAPPPLADAQPVWKSNFGRPTPSTRCFLRSCVCSMAWSFQAMDATLSP